MERLKENQEEMLTIQEYGKNELEAFISYWDKMSEDLKNREIDEDNSNEILTNFEKNRMSIYIFRKAYEFDLNDNGKLKLTESKLHTSLAIARSNYRSKHKTILERLIDNMGGFLHIFGKGNN